MGAVEVAAGAGGTLSWKSRDPSWWNSAVQLSSNLSSSAKELTSTLASKMDQVPAALTGFTLPWQPVSSHKDQQQQQQQPLLLDQQQPSSLSGFDHPWNVVVLMEEEKKSPELPKPVQEQLPVAPGPSLTAADLRHLSKVGESRRRTKRMPVVMASSSSSGCNNNIDATTNRDVFSAAAASCASLHTAGLSSVSQRFLLGDDAQIDELRCNSMERLPRIENRFAKAIQLNVTQGSSSDIKYVNEASLVLSNAPSPNHSIGQALPCPSEDRSIINRQQAGSRPKTTLVHLANLEPAAIPKEDVFPGNSNTLSVIRLRKSSSISSEHGRKLANSLLFDSQALCAVESESPIVGGSMRVPRHLDTQLESSATVPSASLPTTPRGKSKSRASRLLQRLRLGGARKGKKDSGKKGVSKAGSVTTDFTCNHQHEDRHHEIMEGNHMHSGSLIQGCQCNDPTEVVKPEQKNTSRWPFNKWKWSSRSQSKVLSADPHTVDTRSSQASREFSTTTSKTAHHDDASKSFPEMIVRFSSPQLTKSASLDMGVKHRRGSSWGSGRDAASRQLLPPLAGNDIMAISNLERFSSSDPSKTSYVEVSLSSSSVCQSSKDSQEQDSGQKAEEEENTAEVFQDCESESKLVKRMSQSMGVLEWGRTQMPPLLLPEQKLTIEEVAALCSSPLKFLFKCREIELFNKFLRCQKKRITNSLHADNHDCFHIIHSGAECEVSSMVCALLMAWSMESTAPPAKANNWHLVPVVNIPRQSMHKHKDAAWLFDACGVDARALLFSDEVELEKLMKAGRIRTEEIGRDLLVTKNEVGSICTLLGEQLQMEAQFLLQARYMKTLLVFGAIPVAIAKAPFYH
jgi:hypothetical protein